MNEVKGLNIYWDTEANGWVHTATHMHCALFKDEEDHWESFTGYERKALREYFKYISNKGYTLVGHNIIKYDFPLLQELYGIEWKGGIIDTLVLSKLTFPDRKRHSLQYLIEGITGNKKIEINNWIDDSDFNYFDRCQTDVEYEQEVYLWLINNQRFNELKFSRSNWL